MQNYKYTAVEEIRSVTDVQNKISGTCHLLNLAHIFTISTVQAIHMIEKKEVTKFRLNFKHVENMQDEEPPTRFKTKGKNYIKQLYNIENQAPSISLGLSLTISQRKLKVEHQIKPL
jgi:hypothetical protein